MLLLFHYTAFPGHVTYLLVYPHSCHVVSSHVGLPRHVWSAPVGLLCRIIPKHSDVNTTQGQATTMYVPKKGKSHGFLGGGGLVYPAILNRRWERFGGIEKPLFLSA